MGPNDIRIVGDKELLITWEDGQRSLYSNVYLQLHCRCAHCIDEHSGAVLVKETNLDPEAKLLEVIPVGNYGIRFRWSKGCQSGLYGFDHLKSIRPQNEGA